MNKALSSRTRFHDWPLFILSLLATLVGILFIFDAGYARSIQHGHGIIPREFKGQLIFLVVSLVTYILCLRISGDKWRRWSKIIFSLSFGSLILVEIPGIGMELNGARRWIGLGPIMIQPAEFMKVALILYISSVMMRHTSFTRPTKKITHWSVWMDYIFLPRLIRWTPAFLVLCSTILIEKEPDLGTAAVLVVTGFIMFVIGGVSKESVLIASLMGIMGITFLVKKQPYRLERILNHSQRWSPEMLDDLGYQTTQSETAMAGGGLFGVGIGAGRSKHMLPAATTDFILATIAEEVGFLGACGVICLLGGITIRLVVLGQQNKNRFTQMVLYGTASWMGIQTCTNIMMANGSLPAIGIPLPFVSSGGSSLLALWIAIGICQSVLHMPLEEKKIRNKNKNEDTVYRRGHGRPYLSGT